MKPEPLLGKRTLSEETKKKISSSLKGHPCYMSKERNDKIRKSHIGMKRSYEHKKSISKSLIGNTRMKGKIDELNNNWKGDNAGYVAKHIWISKKKGKACKCELNGCKANIYHWANISGEYKRETKDYIQLCPICHSFLDRNKININQALLLKHLFDKRKKSAVEWLLLELNKTLPKNLAGMNQQAQQIANITRLHNQFVESLIRQAFEDVCFKNIKDILKVKTKW